MKDYKPESKANTCVLISLAVIPPCTQYGAFNYEEMKNSLQKRLHQFDDTPYNLQRLCELLLEPRKYYSRVDKYMRGLEKVLWGKAHTTPYSNGQGSPMISFLSSQRITT